MIYTLTLNPFVGVQLAAVLQLIAMIIWTGEFHKIRIPNKNIEKVFTFFKEFFYNLFGLIGILFIDISISWIIGSWSYADWRFQLPSVLLIFILGIEYTLYCYFQKGSLLKMIYAILASLTLTLFIHWWVPLEPVMGPRIENNILIILGILLAVYAVISIIHVIVNGNNHRKRTFLRDYWDITQKLQKIFNIKVNLIIWILVTIQAMLCYFGYSLFALL
ncbi:MAG: hypothetical protein GF364_10245 [Candidatus Lokiarchaeota archaeon]|nr:hypothetical protein [Candidatus Lokiarchaeota archaeon]